MKIPNKLKIGALWYPVRFVPGADIDCDGRSVGDTASERQDIRISTDIQTQEMRELTLFHEIIHCINDQMEHESVEYLAQAFYQVCKENKFNFSSVTQNIPRTRKPSSPSKKRR